MNAYVNHGRWVADCDTPYCTEAQRVQPGAVFLCGNCGQSYQPTFPDDKVLIDAALDRRIVPATQNWMVGETVNDLINENRQHEEVVT